ncbi:MAG: hypothetical protein IKU71_05105 [Kiritimatiellae bacterium]|nr:hypothetical protein [Kiritimatiellia bacterium]
MKRRGHRWRWRIDMDVLRCILFFSFLVLVFALLGLLANGIVIVVRMCLRGDVLGFALLSALVLLVMGFFVVRRVSRGREFKALLSRGVDFGLKDESLQLVDEIIEKHGKRCRRASALKVEVAPMVRSIASRYNSIRIGKKTVFNSHDLRTGDSIGFKGSPDDSYLEIAHEDEFGYLVKCSPSDETIYYCEYEWMREPIPHASDIRHYIALRYQEQSGTGPAKA